MKICKPRHIAFKCWQFDTNKLIITERTELDSYSYEEWYKLEDMPFPILGIHEIDGGPYDFRNCSYYYVNSKLKSMRLFHGYWIIDTDHGISVISNDKFQKLYRLKNNK